MRGRWRVVSAVVVPMLAPASFKVVDVEELRD